ncbi:phosphotransferase [Isoptericola sp. b490]|uniref:phosphotransferase n=1 Tax=Actinotalea lenta TaxID=3064654 RepID=UPI0027143EEE|nr:phosphotransferase [Isoptericola sp. b490]MDO8122687.1 phosphotransferase [Isoptericola sp. b490]
MARSPLVLAALSTVAVPDLDAVDVRRASHPGPGIDAAVVIDATGGRWTTRAPQDAAAGAALEAEVALLAGLVTHVDSGALPFEVPRLAGSVSLPEGGRAVVHRQLPGRPIRLEELGPGPGLAAALGRAIAAIHELPVSVVEHAGLPVYDADSYRRRRLSELDEAARTGYVPAFLLRRWERALEDVALWHFQPTVVHGDLSAEHVLVRDDVPVGVLGWSETKVADPADDLAWLLVAAPQPAVDPIIEAYHLRRTELRDPHLATRALLAGELAVVRWLMHGVNIGDQAVIDDARSMLDELEEHLTRYEAAAREAAAEQETARQEAAARETDTSAAPAPNPPVRRSATAAAQDQLAFTEDGGAAPDQAWAADDAERQDDGGHARAVDEGRPAEAIPDEESPRSSGVEWTGEPIVTASGPDVDQSGEPTEPTDDAAWDRPRQSDQE